MRRLSVRFVSVLAIGSVWLAGLAPTHAQAPQATFKADVNVIEVDARVSDADGLHVADLTVDDFEVLEDGQPQKVELFSYVDIPVTPRPVFAGVDRPVSPDVRSTSDPATGRMYIIVLDDANIEAIHLAAVKRQAREFIEEYLGAGDIASIAYTSGTTNASQDFTSDPQVLLAAVDRFVGRRGASAAAEQAEKFYQDRLTLELDPPPGAKPEDIPALAADLQSSRKQVLGAVAKPTVDIRDFERAQRAVNVLATVRQLAQSVENVRGRRKALVLFSEGIGYQLTDPFGMRSVSDIVNATRDAINAAARANVNFYTIDPRGLVGASSEGMQMTGAGMPEGATQVAMMNEFRTSQDSLRVLAEETGGFASLDSNSFASSFERIVDSNSRYYVIGYRLPNRPADGQFHKIEVRVKRPGVTVVARKGYGSSRDRMCRRSAEGRGRTPCAGGAPTKCRQDVHRASQRPRQRHSAARLDVFRPRCAVQKHRERGVGGDDRRDRRRSLAASAAGKARSVFLWRRRPGQGKYGRAQGDRSRCEIEHERTREDAWDPIESENCACSRTISASHRGARIDGRRERFDFLRLDRARFP